MTLPVAIEQYIVHLFRFGRSREQLQLLDVIANAEGALQQNDTSMWKRSVSQ